MDTLSSLNPVRTRSRARSATTTLPTPLLPEHTNYRHSQPDPHWRRSQPELSTSAPTSYLNPPSITGSSNSGDSTRNNIITDGSSNTSSSCSSGSSISVVFEGGSHVVIRPNRIIRGTFYLDLAEKTQVTRIRIKFRAEEYATVKVDEAGADGKSDWIYQATTTFFESDYKLFGNEALSYSQSAWEEMDIGHYEFPFALKFPNVNYPPSIEEPPGFGIRYIWTGQIDGPGLQSGLRSRDYITPYRPIIVSTEEKEWTYRTTLTRDKKQALAEVRGKLFKQCYCPDEPFSMQLSMTTLHSDCKIGNISFKFRKHHEGKMILQQGTAFRENVHTVLQGKIPLTDDSTNTNLSELISFNIPTKLVSPSFSTRHTRIYYDLQFQVQLLHGQLFKVNHTAEFAIPLSIANLPHEQLLRVPDLTSTQFYQDSKECPNFFDPDLDEPPEPRGLPSELIGPLTSALVTPPQHGEEQPPSYFSLSTLPPQLEIRKERKERTVYTSAPARGAYYLTELAEAIIVHGLYDEYSW
ncbi:hypothetical protein BCR42DRAFT_486247 [Absidia repens]|uniref:Uncharacterized protein n=1 Tax=Absidia repens TaxID=90262 RepID=A0A1X2J2Z8_9FUNG|nr:hypothetical protein BCR42DRAFT_486247 [Absidia repens]